MDVLNVEVLKFGGQAVISIGGAFLAAWLAAGRYRKDKWWEKKAATYTEMIDALHRMKWPANTHLEAAYEEKDVPKAEADKLWEEFKAARRNVWRIADGSAFLISASVLEAVTEMEKDLQKARNAESWMDHLEEQYGAVNTCLDRVKKIGKKELSVR